MTAPLVYVEPPEVTPYRFGLFGAAQPYAGIDPHAFFGGAEWESLACYAASSYAAGWDICNGGGGSKVLNNGAPSVQAKPFGVYAGIDCGTVGYDHEGSYQERTRKILELAGQHATEAALWTGAGGNLPALNAVGFATTVVFGTAPSGAVRIAHAIGALEKWLGDNYQGVGVIHATRDVAAIAAEAFQIDRDPANASALVTPLGTRVVFGGGYNGTGPGAVVPGAGTTWIYATGQVMLARNEPRIFNMEEALKRGTNRVAVFGEQQYLIGVDCPKAGAALVDLKIGDPTT